MIGEGFLAYVLDAPRSRASGRSSTRRSKRGGTARPSPGRGRRRRCSLKLLGDRYRQARPNGGSTRSFARSLPRVPPETISPTASPRRPSRCRSCSTPARSLTGRARGAAPTDCAKTSPRRGSSSDAPGATVIDPMSLETARDLLQSGARAPRPVRGSRCTRPSGRDESRLRRPTRRDRPRQVAHRVPRVPPPRPGRGRPCTAHGAGYPTAPVISSWMRRFSSSA